MNLLEKRQGHQGTQCLNFGAPRPHVQRGIVFFASLSSRLRYQFVGNPETKKREYLYNEGRFQEDVMAIRIAVDPVYIVSPKIREREGIISPLSSRG